MIRNATGAAWGALAAALTFAAAAPSGAASRGLAAALALSCGTSLAQAATGEAAGSWMRASVSLGALAAPLAALLLLSVGIGSLLAAGVFTALASFLALGCGAGALAGTASEASASRAWAKAVGAAGLAVALALVASAPLESPMLRRTTLLLGPLGLLGALAAPALGRRVREALSSPPLVVPVLLLGLWLLREGLPSNVPPFERKDLLLAALVFFAGGYCGSRWERR